MSLTKENYKERLIDEKLTKYLSVFGAVSIEGPKWCGKTWTSLNHANSVVYMTEKDKKDYLSSLYSELYVKDIIEQTPIATDNILLKLTPFTLFFVVSL